MMKNRKQTLALLLLLSLLLVCFAGCTTPTDPQGGTETDPATDPAPSGKPNPPEPIVEGELDNESDLVSTLSVYWKEIHTSHDLGETGLPTKIGDIKKGVQPLHVTFDPDNTYFVCGYYNPPSPGYSYKNHGKEFTWVLYKNAEDVKEYYNDTKWIALFQFNRALTVTDLLPGEREVPNVEHFNIILRPTFENGVYTGTPEVYDDTYIYLNDPDCTLNRCCKSTSTRYYSNTNYFRFLYVIPCVALEGEYYVSDRAYTIYADGSRGNESNYMNQFGQYYDVLMGMMEKEKYTKPGNNGVTHVYNAIPLEGFVNGVLK